MMSETPCTDAERSETAVAQRAVVMTLSDEAIMVAHLLESGWKLHLSQKPEDGHAIFKTTRTGSTTQVERCEVSADAVLELQQARRLKKVRQFTVNHKKTTVFVSA